MGNEQQIRSVSRPSIEKNHLYIRKPLELDRTRSNKNPQAPIDSLISKEIASNTSSSMQCTLCSMFNLGVFGIFIAEKRTSATRSPAGSKRDTTDEAVSIFTVTYYPSAWLRFLVFTLSWQINPVPFVQLRIPQYLPPDAEVFIAVRNGECSKIQTLIMESKASIYDVVAPYGLSLLNLAIIYGQMEACLLLISLGVHRVPLVNLHSAEKDLWKFWEEYKSWQCALSPSQILGDHGLQMSSQPQRLALNWIYQSSTWEFWDFSRLHKSTLMLSNEDISEVLKNSSLDMDEVDGFGRSAVHLAVYAQNKLALVALIDHGAKLNLQDYTGKMPIHIAASSGSVDFITLLVQGQANVNAQDQLGNTALAYACMEGYRDVVEALLDFGADINMKNFIGESPIRYAIFADNFELTTLLHQRGASFTSKDMWGSSMLHLAIRFNAHRVLRYLLQTVRIRTDGKYNSGKTTFHILAESADTETITIFFKQGEPKLDILSKDNNGLTALDFIERKQWHDITKDLLIDLFLPLTCKEEEGMQFFDALEYQLG
jgi:ankyrin repeat protein